MLGPQYQRLFEIQQRLTGKQIFQRIKQNGDNPLQRVIAKLKRQFTQYETQYDNPMMDYQISSLDRILSFDNKLGPILDALQKENHLLRKQLANLENHLSQSVGICENILNENNELKAIIKKKNEDISKIIETVAGNQAQQVEEFEQKNRLLMLENSILLKHLEEIKKQHDQYTDSLKEKDAERLSFQKKFQESKKQLAQSVSRERQLFRKISMLEQNIYQSTQQIYSLQHNKQNLTFQNNQLKNQILLIKGKNESGGNQALKRQLQSQYEPIVQQHKLLKKERTHILRQAEKAKLENQKLQEYIAELERKISKLSGDLQMTQNILVDKKQELSRVKNNQSKLESKLNQLKQQSNRIRAQKQTNNIYTMNKQKRLQEEIQRLRGALQTKSREIELRMKQIKQSMHGLLESKDSQIRNLRQQTIQLQRLIDRR